MTKQTEEAVLFLKSYISRCTNIDEMEKILLDLSNNLQLRKIKLCDNIHFEKWTDIYKELLNSTDIKHKTNGFYIPTSNLNSILLFYFKDISLDTVKKALSKAGIIKFEHKVVRYNKDDLYRSEYVTKCNF